MKREPRLTDAEMDALFRELRAADDPRSHPARGRLILANAGFAAAVALRFWRRRPPRVDFDDLKAEALRELVEVVDAFDPDHGGRFAVFYGISAHRALDRYYYRNAAPLTIRWPAIYGLMAHDAGRPANVSPDVLEAAIRAREPAISASEDPLQRGGPADRGDALGRWEEQQDAAERVASLLAGLTPKQRRVVEVRYGIGTGEPLGQEDAGRVLGVSYQAVGNVERRALAALRAAG